jgi:hypothetical protein
MPRDSFIFFVLAVASVLGATQATAPTKATRPVGTLAKDGQTLAVSFTYGSKRCEFNLVAKSVYAHDAVVTIQGEQGEHQQAPSAAPRTFVSREKGRSAAAMISEKGDVDGVFLCDGTYFDFPKNVTARKLAASVDGGGSVGRDEDFGQTREGRALNETDDGEEVYDVTVDDMPPKPAAFINGAALENWAGTKWFPGCYAGDSQLHAFKVGLIADVEATNKHGDQLQHLIESAIARTSFVYENQLNIRIDIADLKIYTSSFGAPDYAKGCPDIGTRLDQIKTANLQPLQGATHILTGCGNGIGTVGLAYVGAICATRGFNTGVNQLHNSMSWTTFAHELGHNFGGDHSFEDGQGKTGGIMDYGDGKLNGHYQFNTKYRKGTMCEQMNKRVRNCNGNFDIAEDIPTPPPTTPVPTNPYACYGIAACLAAAKRLDLDASGGADGSFVGDWSETGCYYHTKGSWKGFMWYGLLDNGQEVVEELQLTKISNTDELLGKTRPAGEGLCFEWAGRGVIHTPYLVIIGTLLLQLASFG